MAKRLRDGWQSHSSNQWDYLRNDGGREHVLKYMKYGRTMYAVHYFSLDGMPGVFGVRGYVEKTGFATRDEAMDFAEQKHSEYVQKDRDLRAKANGRLVMLY